MEKQTTIQDFEKIEIKVDEILESVDTIEKDEVKSKQSECCLEHQED